MMSLLFALVLAGAADLPCTDRPECWPEGSALRTRLEAAYQADDQQKRLDAESKALIALVGAARSKDLVPDSSLLTALAGQQAAWKDYVAKECELIGALSGAAENWQSARASQCEAAHIDRRLKRVLAAKKCVLRIPEGERLFEQARCLQQLAPLTNGARL